MHERMYAAGGLSVRSAAGGGLVFYGEPIVYDSWSVLLFGQFVEKLRRGCFDESLASGRDVICTRDHNPSLLLGRLSAGTLKLTPSQRGISCEVIAPDATYAHDLAASLKRGDVNGMSFTFDDVDVEWGQHDGHRSREVVKAILHEVSFVSLPAYPATSAGAGPTERGQWLTLEQMRRIEEMALADCRTDRMNAA